MIIHVLDKGTSWNISSHIDQKSLEVGILALDEIWIDFITDETKYPFWMSLCKGIFPFIELFWHRIKNVYTTLVNFSPSSYIWQQQRVKMVHNTHFRCAAFCFKMFLCSTKASIANSLKTYHFKKIKKTVPLILYFYKINI